MMRIGAGHSSETFENMSILRTAALAASVLAISAAPALAHPKLLSTAPAANAAVAPTDKLTFHFSEELEGKFSGADVTATKMMMGNKMMAHTMKIEGVKASVDPSDQRTMIVSLKSPLGPGTYKVDWHAVSTDTHRVAGTFVFSVK